MIPPLFVRPFTSEEHHALEEALRSPESFTLRRAQILCQSAKGQRPSQIAESLSCASQTVRNAIHAFNERGLAALTPQSRQPKAIETAFDESARERLLAIAHTSPRHFGKPRSVWTLELLAEVSFDEGLTEARVDKETIRRTISKLGSSWQRAKHWITSPDPQYALKKSKSAA